MGEEDRKSLTPQRQAPPTSQNLRRDSIFGQPLRVKPKTPSKSKNSIQSATITPQRRLSLQRTKTPIETIRLSRLSLNLRSDSQMKTPIQSRSTKSSRNLPLMVAK